MEAYLCDPCQTRLRELVFTQRSGRIQSAERAVPTHCCDNRLSNFFQPDTSGQTGVL